MRDYGAAAVADEGRPLAHVLAELGEAPLLGFVQQVEALGGRDRARVSVRRERPRGGAEGEADLPGSRAGPPEVLHLVPAVAQADRDRGGITDGVAGPLVVEHAERQLVRDRPLAHERASDILLTADSRTRSFGSCWAIHPRAAGSGAGDGRVHPPSDAQGNGPGARRHYAADESLVAYGRFTVPSLRRSGCSRKNSHIWCEASMLRLVVPTNHSGPGPPPGQVWPPPWIV